MDAEGGGGGVLPPLEARPQPPGDLRRQVPQGISAGKVDPHARLVLSRRIRDDDHRISVVQIFQEPFPATEHGSVERGTKGRRSGGGTGIVEGAHWYS
jgi:hypothetical protein